MKRKEEEQNKGAMGYNGKRKGVSEGTKIAPASMSLFYDLYQRICLMGKNLMMGKTNERTRNNEKNRNTKREDSIFPPYLTHSFVKGRP